MSKTILITGASSGIGKSIALYFANKGWQVAATMRHPEKESELKAIPQVRCLRLDVTETQSIQKAIEDTIEAFGGIDVIVNNAGYGAVGVFEKSTEAQIRRQLDVNVFGAMNVIRAILPYFRSKKSGTIINITSVGALITFPLYSAYHATKWALDGFAESLHYELKPLGIRVKNIEPGAIKTDFYDRSQDLFVNEDIRDYDEYERICFANMQDVGTKAPLPEIVAKTVWKAANSRSSRLRYPVGTDAKMLLFFRRILPYSWFFAMVRTVVEKGFKGRK